MSVVAHASTDPAEPGRVPRPGAAPAPSSLTGHWYFTHHQALRLRPEYRGLTLNDVRTLDALISHADRDGMAWPPMRRIARFCCGASNGTISESLRTLEQRGFVRIERGDRTHASRYHLWTGDAVVQPPVWATATHTGVGDGHPRNTHINTHPQSQKENEKGAQRAFGSSSLHEVPQDEERDVKREGVPGLWAVRAVREVCADFDDKHLIHRFVARFGRAALARMLSLVRRRKPKQMKNRAAYLSSCLRNELDGHAEQDEIEYEAKLEAAWAPTLLPPPGWRPRATSRCAPPSKAVAAVERAVPAGRDDADLRERPVRSSEFGWLYALLAVNEDDVDPVIAPRAAVNAAIHRRDDEIAAEQEEADRIELGGALSPDGD